jgi:acyl carrier protein
MTVEQKVIRCVAKALNLDYELLNLESKNTDFEYWDSFGQIAIITEIEREFGVQFSVEDIYVSTSINRLLSKIKEYTQSA